MYSESTDSTALTLNIAVTSLSGTEILETSTLPAVFTSKEDLKVYLDRLAESKLDNIAQELAKKLGGVVLQQPIENEAYQKFTERIVKPGTTYAYVPNSVIYEKTLKR